MNKELLEYADVGEDAPDDEIWKLCEDNKHSVSNYGRIINIGTLHKIDSRGRKGITKPFILKNRLSSNTYYVTYNNNFVHRLVAIAFIENPNNKLEVNHIDGNKLNNHCSNLEWATRSENQSHAYRIGLQINRPEVYSVLNRNQVEEIREFYKSGFYTQKTLANKYGVKQQSISKIIKYKRWK